MNHFAIISVLLQHTHRNLSAHQVKKLGQLKHRGFQKAKKQFVLPLPKLIALSQGQPVRLIMDYVLIGRNTREITFPFNYTFNPNSWRMEPTIFVLFILAEIGDKVYPVFLDFWGQEEWETDDGLHLTKLDVARSAVLSLHEQGLEIGELLFDAGFCSKAFVMELQTFKIPFVCRFPRSWKLYNKGEGRTAAQLFRNNRKFFYDRHLGCHLIARRGQFADQAVKLVAVANTRQKLDERKYYCLLTNQVKLNHTEILRHYKFRGKIEAFFKVLKSYLGMGAFHRHHPDEALIPHFQMRCAAFVILQDYAADAGRTLFQALAEFRLLSQPEIRLRLSVYWFHWAQHLVDPSKETFKYQPIRMAVG
jgi:hypothetical protein